MTDEQARRQVAAAARRAGGERTKRRRTTPLLADREPVVPNGDLEVLHAVTEEPPPPGPAPAARNGRRKTVAPTPVVLEPDVVPTGLAETVEPAAVPPEPPEPPVPPEPAETVAPAAEPEGRPRVRASRQSVRVRARASRRTAGGERLVAVGDSARDAGEALGEDLLDVVTSVAKGRAPADPDALEERIRTVLAFLRRRLTGDFAVDEFGYDPEFTDTVLLNVFRPLYRRWFRVETRGLENVPSSGSALVVANHSGAIALDAIMVTIALRDEHPAHRSLRMLGADLVFSTPLIADFARKGGATLATNPDAERLLTSGEVVGVWPEGFKGIGKPFSERYKLQRFGRGGFVSAALRTGAPIVPCAIVGAEETYPIIGNLGTVARLLGLPYLPVTPTFPLLGLLGMIPLPSKWLIEFNPPVPTDGYGAGAADDPMMVFDLTDQVRQTIQQSLYSLLVQRRSVFF